MGFYGVSMGFYGVSMGFYGVLWGSMGFYGVKRRTAFYVNLSLISKTFECSFVVGCVQTLERIRIISNMARLLTNIFQKSLIRQFSTSQSVFAIKGMLLYVLRINHKEVPFAC